jgi:hypothetical protein
MGEVFHQLLAHRRRDLGPVERVADVVGRDVPNTATSVDQRQH